MGCGSSGDSDPPQPVAKPAATLEAYAHVSLLGTEGEMAHVRTADGKEFYIRQDRLQDRSTLDRSDEDYTHVLSAAADAYEEPPSELPIPEPRPTKDVALESISLNQLYLSEKTLTEVIAPARFMTPWDEELGERCFPALTCNKPDCPGEGKGDRPYLFIIPYSPGGGGGQMICPACSKGRALSTWTEEERQEYFKNKWVQPYLLPDQAERLEQLEEEMRASARARRSR
jgi:hypothetical protein